MNAKQLIKSLPVVRTVVQKLKDRKAPPLIGSSGEYWEDRYKSGGNSGAGSYGRLAEFKADFINDFIVENQVNSVIEFGSGDGAQLALARYPSYVGVDVSPTIVAKAQSAFEGNPKISFIHTSEVTPQVIADLSLSLDVIYHLVEDDTFENYMDQLFNAATKAVIIYASNENKRWHDGHVRHRRFTDWVKRNRSDVILERRVPNRYPYDPADPNNTSFADFYVYRKT